MLKTSLKLLVAGSTIAAIGWGILTMHPDQGVQQADADILSLGFAPKGNTQKFQDSLDELGMDKPRQYDWNGNKMFFSTMVTDEEPLQVLDRMQRKFYEKGLNDKVYSGVQKAPLTKDLRPGNKADQAAALAHVSESFEKNGNFFTGGIIPQVVTEDYVSMSGMDSKSNAKDPIAFIKEVHARKSSRLSDSVGAVRVVEAFREANKTRVTATWTDDEVDFAKFRNASNKPDVGGDAKIPACMGCERVMRFKGETDEGYTATLFQAKSMPKNDVVSFYTRAMTNRGWRMAPAALAMEAAEKQGLRAENSVEFLAFARGKEFVTILVYVDEEGRTIAKVMESI